MSIGDNLPDSFDPDVQIMGVDFSDDYTAVEITYMERRNVADLAFKRESVTIGGELLPRDEIREVLETVQDWLDAALLHIRTKGGA